MAAKPAANMDEGVATPLDPELTTTWSLLQVDPHAEPAADAVDEMERESFPASDPPSTWAGPEETA